MRNYARSLHEIQFAYDFLVQVLEINKEDANTHCTKIMTAELVAQKLLSTLDNQDSRQPKYRTDDSRITLRRRIFDELVNYPRADNDEDICLGNGGARPKNQPKADRVAIIVTGLPASGKSKIASQLADAIDAYIIDSDFAKRKIPEFKEQHGASIVHDESSVVTYGSSDSKYRDEYNLFEYCIAHNFNLVVPKIGASTGDIRKLRDALVSKDYSVHLVLVGLDRQEACRRAFQRYIETQRYVPLGLIFDAYGNDPILTYYRIRDDTNWKSTLKLSSEFLRDKGPLLVHQNGNSPAATLCTGDITS